MTFSTTAGAIPLDAYCGYLTVLAEAQIGHRLRGKVDPGDVVQMTLLKACQKVDGYRGSDERELRGWLRSILANIIIDQLRKCDGRDGAARERSLEAAIEASSLALDRILEDGGSSPSHKFARHERLLLLTDAIGRLPDEQRIAVELRHLKDQPLDVIATEMSKSIPAVAGLLRRGLKSLRLDLNSLA